MGPPRRNWCTWWTMRSWARATACRVHRARPPSWSSAPISPRSCRRRLRPEAVMPFLRMRATPHGSTTSIWRQPRRARSTFDFDGELLGFGHHQQLDARRRQLAWRHGLQICAPSGSCGYIEGFNIDLTGTTSAIGRTTGTRPPVVSMRPASRCPSNAQWGRKLDLDHPEWMDRIWWWRELSMAPVTLFYRATWSRRSRIPPNSWRRIPL